MGTEAPTPVVIPRHCAPMKAPCPKCGKHGRRKRTKTRRVRTVAYKAIAYLEITYGEYGARCDCSTTFSNTPEGVLPKAHYDNRVRDLGTRRRKDVEFNGRGEERGAARRRRRQFGRAHGAKRRQAFGRRQGLPAGFQTKGMSAAR